MEDGKPFLADMKQSIFIRVAQFLRRIRSCDYRRAVIILCIISLVFSVLGLVTNTNSATDISQYPRLQEILDDQVTNATIVGVVGIVMTIGALVGAIVFNFYAVSL